MTEATLSPCIAEQLEPVPFIGSGRYLLDNKHRLRIPPTYQERLGTPVYLTLGAQHLELRPREEWQRKRRTLEGPAAERFCGLSWEIKSYAGRVQLPYEIWREFGWGPGAEIAIVGQGSWVCVEKVADWLARVRGERLQPRLEGML